MSRSQGAIALLPIGVQSSLPWPRDELRTIELPKGAAVPDGALQKGRSDRGLLMRSMCFFWQRRWRWRGRLLDSEQHPSQPSKLFRGLTPLVAKVRPRRPATLAAVAKDFAGNSLPLIPYVLSRNAFNSACDDHIAI